MKKLSTSIFALVLLWTGVAYAQTPPSFVVATVKLAPPEAQGMRIGSPAPGRLTLLNMTLQGMIGFAWGGAAGTMQVSGGPNWLDKDRYNVEAQAEGQPSMNDMRLMLRSLLIERFALKTHNTTKEIDVYNMVLARNDKKLGPKVTDWDGKCAGGREPPPASPGNPRCSAFFRPPGLVMVGVSMSVLANMLGGQVSGLGRPVVDKTGLTGEYNMELEYKFPPPPGPGGPPPAAASDDPFAPSLFTAVQEQLGVKLQSAKGTADVLVVDQANHPTEN